jgi:hypothetical protein
MDAESKKMQYEMKDALRQKLDAFKERDQAQSMLAGVEYQIEQNKSLYQKREKELVDCLNEARTGRSEEDLKAKLKMVEESLKQFEEVSFTLKKNLMKSSRNSQKHFKYFLKINLNF